MSEPTAVRPIDAAALRHVGRRLAAASEAPWLHAEIGRRMAERLPLIRLQPDRIIDWWSYTGGSAQALATRYPEAERIAVEPTPELVARSAAAGRAPWWSPRRWAAPMSHAVLEDPHDGDLRDAQLVWSNMMLQAVADPPALFSRWLPMLAVDGVLMFSCFGPDTLRELSGLYAAAGWPPPTIPFVDLHDLGDMLVDAGYAEPVMDQETITLSWANADAALAELRRLGGNVSPERRPGLSTPRWRAALQQRMERSAADAEGRVRLTFEVTYGHAFKPATRARTPGVTTVSLDRLRSLVKTPGNRDPAA